MGKKRIVNIGENFESTASIDDIDAALFAAELGGNVPKLDLHGLTRAQASVAVDQFIHRNYNHTKPVPIEIIFGIGKGILSDAVQKELSNHPLVKRIKTMVGSCVVVV